MTALAATLLSWIGAAVSAFGLVVILAGAVGQLRRPAGTRGVHFLQLILGPGAGLVLLGLAVGAANAIVALKLGLLWAALCVVGPLISGALAAAAHEEAAHAATPDSAPR